MCWIHTSTYKRRKFPSETCCTMFFEKVLTEFNFVINCLRKVLEFFKKRGAIFVNKNGDDGVSKSVSVLLLIVPSKWLRNSNFIKKDFIYLFIHSFFFHLCYVFRKCTHGIQFHHNLSSKGVGI